MKFCIITHVLHKKINEQFFAYGPYVREMNLWLNFDDEIILVAPLSDSQLINNIEIAYKYPNINFIRIPEIEFTNLASVLNSVIKLPKIFFSIYEVMRSADHIHLRCPGNIGLIGTIVQLFFPNKKKTAKYAGNWDPLSNQPLTYKFQKWILGNTYITKNIKVLIYGEWKDQNKNLKSFFTASYKKNDIMVTENRYILDKLKLIYVGSLVSSKNPLLSVKVAKKLIHLGRDVELNIYGDGTERKTLEDFIFRNHLTQNVILHGNVNSEKIKQAYKESHFLIFISKSEGWPKVVAESMFWGCVPITTSVSCVPWMLDYGNRGYLVQEDENLITNIIVNISQNEFNKLSLNAANWSKEYTLDKFELEVKELLK